MLWWCECNERTSGAKKRLWSELWWCVNVRLFRQRSLVPILCCATLYLIMILFISYKDYEVCLNGKNCCPSTEVLERDAWDFYASCITFLDKVHFKRMHLYKAGTQSCTEDTRRTRRELRETLFFPLWISVPPLRSLCSCFWIVKEV